MGFRGVGIVSEWSFGLLALSVESLARGGILYMGSDASGVV